jgi:hypothetical protein
MGRLSTIVKNILSADDIRYVDLLELHFSSDAGGVKLLTNAPHNITIPAGTDTLSGSRTFVSNGAWLSWGTPSETGAPVINTSAITLSPTIDSGYYANIFLNKAYIGTRAVIYRQFFDPQTSPLDDQGAPVMMWDGEMTSFKIQDSQDNNIIQVQTANIFYDFDAVNCRRTNTASQSQYFPNDKGFEFATQDIKDLSWGKKV